jgi:hypothetical protein
MGVARLFGNVRNRTLLAHLVVALRLQLGGALVARRVGIISAGLRLVVIRAGSSSADSGSADTYGHATAHGSSAIRAAVIDAAMMDAAVTGTDSTAASIR